MLTLNCNENFILFFEKKNVLFIRKFEWIGPFYILTIFELNVLEFRVYPRESLTYVPASEPYFVGLFHVSWYQLSTDNPCTNFSSNLTKIIILDR